tara:strand:+ start:6091 stop:6465 length:375 start_codon:yes stop_codon:yes gene_type:complete
MENLINILIWCLVVFSISNTIAVSALLRPIRDYLYPPGIHERGRGEWIIYDHEKEDWIETSKRPVPFFGKLITCTMCLGFWVGLVVSVLWFSPSHNIVIDGFFGSIVAWMLFLFIQEKQNIGRG